ncbi:MAG: response regulator, partial [Chitinivibrionales bacterium]|nr:response regulator [Chitinivibrionales bacterium]
MPQELAPFYFLDNTVNILLVDDDPKIVELLRKTLGMLTVFNIRVADTTRKAASLLESPDRFHSCIFDLGLSDVDNDEFYLLKNFYRHTSFIVLTGATSATKGFLAGQYGAMG